MEYRVARRFFTSALASLLISLAGPASSQTAQLDASVASGYWVGSWSSAPQPAATRSEMDGPQFNHQTLRQIVRASLGGNRVRVRLSNAYGKQALVIGEAGIALRASGPSAVPGSNRTLTFNGQAGITLAPGATAVSDPVSLRVSSLQDLAVSIYLPQPTPAATQHLKSRQTNYVSTQGNFVAAAAQPGVFSNLCTEGQRYQNCSSSWYFLSGVEVESSPPAAAVVAFGDSITNGAWSSANKNRRWTDVLARRLADNGQSLAVLNQGIGGNALLSAGRGPSGRQRFERDVLDQPGAQFAIVLLGINDIKKGVAADNLIAGHRALIAQARARGLKIIGATLTPFGKANNRQEVQRSALNQWIRNSGEFDAVIDFDAALRDPNNPRRMRPGFDCGDSLHPNNAGYEAMGNAIDLALFRSAAR
ncbi:SGNH/GDSL hydrolase family protein [uncultured Azohydromonas sp.]|jgi:Lysophospholipase L1 and related esterases|uniref:SGNH/GDSL hydrolase family protein n=1 Tax=uncultured Azohydromonas sp. TaxID=487342 RepID=UPI0026292BE6|nr:SGNH/GDSL hydrolase family protein [uncultured Azohydromonas sp.]